MSPQNPGWYPNSRGEQQYWDGQRWLPNDEPSARPATPETRPSQPAMGPQPQSNGLAVAALVLGLLGFVFSLLASIPGIVLGHLGRRRARELNGDGAGIALAGLVLSYIITVASVLAILFIAIFIPVFLNQTTKAWNSAVESDLRNAATAQEVAFTSTQSYEVSASGLEQYGFVPSSSSNYNSPVRVITATRTGYCMQATSASGQTYHISSGGSVTTGPC